MDGRNKPRSIAPKIIIIVATIIVAIPIYIAVVNAF